MKVNVLNFIMCILWNVYSNVYSEFDAFRIKEV